MNLLLILLGLTIGFILGLALSHTVFGTRLARLETALAAQLGTLESRLKSHVSGELKTSAAKIKSDAESASRTWASAMIKLLRL